MIRTIFIYALGLAALAWLLQFIEYQYAVRVLPESFYVFLIALLFTGLGIWAGLGIAVVASTIYVIGWEINLAVTDYKFIEDYTQSIIDQREAEGLSEEEMQAVYVEMEEMKAQYNKVLSRLFMTFLEIFPVGLLISFVAASFLRRSEVLPAHPA